jgi:hypothetical protein
MFLSRFGLRIQDRTPTWQKGFCWHGAGDPKSAIQTKTAPLEAPKCLPKDSGKRVLPSAHCCLSRLSASSAAGCLFTV